MFAFVSLGFPEFVVLVLLVGMVAALLGPRAAVARAPEPPADAGPNAAYFVTANVWFLAGVVLLLGGETLFGYARVQPAAYWGGVWLTFGVAAVYARRWRWPGGPSPVTRDVALVGLVGLTLLAGVFGWRLLGDAANGRLHVEGYIFSAGLGIAFLGAFATLLNVVRGRSAELVGFGGAAVCFGVATFGLAFAAGAPEGALPAVIVLLVIALGLGGAVFLSVVGAVRAFRRTTPRELVEARPGHVWHPDAPRQAGKAFAVTLALVLAAVVFVTFIPIVESPGKQTVPTVWGVLLVAFLSVLAGCGIWVMLRPKPGTVPAPVSEPKADPVPAAAIPPRPCPRCGQPIAAGAPEGLCARCLFGGVLAPNTRNSPTVAYGPFVPPPVEEVAALFPQLEVVRLVGAGGMGAVYLARQPSLDRPVALKLVRPHDDDPAFAERFVREAKALARLNHPNVVTVHESGTAGGRPYLLMEFVDGVTLRDAMRERRLSPAEALAIVPQLCDALEYAHSQGVVHRDVKPENILLTRDGRVKIADFGLAKVADPAGVSLTATNQAMGTPHYMAPEQWERPNAVDHRADIYALGVVLYELLTGELPLGRFDPPSQKIQLDIRIDEVVLRALAKEPERRYQHASEVKADLGRIERSGGRVGRPTFREYRSKTTFLGWPLVHVAVGWDPQTGRRKIAAGWVAVGDGAAVGAVAVAGGWAVGGLAVGGGGAVGVFSLAGGMALGVLALAGGWATAVLVAGAGGLALSGGLAVAGGYALGQFAVGSSAAGNAVVSVTRQDPDFLNRLRDWAGWLAEHLWPF